MAIARGANSSATAGFVAGDTHDQARVTGANSVAFTGAGRGNTATVTGDGSVAGSGLGDGNTATTGTDSGATAEGTNQTAHRQRRRRQRCRRFRKQQQGHRLGQPELRQRQRGQHNIAVTPNCIAEATGGGATDRC